MLCCMRDSYVLWLNTCVYSQTVLTVCVTVSELVHSDREEIQEM